MSTVMNGRIWKAGFLGGLVLNLIDTPWSVLVMVPRMEAFSRAHQLEASALAGPWFLLTHFAYMLMIAWIHAQARGPGGRSYGSALLVAAAVLLVNRAFGLGNVLIGVLPLDVFLGFSLSFVAGTLLGGLAIAWTMDRNGASMST
jgi:hypothetical protein